MNSFRTEVNPEKSDIKIDYTSCIFLTGSCFSQNMGQKLVGYGFDAHVNPFGVLYNPVSIANSLEILMSDKVYNEKDISFYNGQWLSFDHYTGFSHVNKNECLQNINSQLEKAKQKFSRTTHLIITFGTSWVYELISTGKVVANCHKVPAKEFNRFFIEQEKIFNIYSSLFEKLLKAIPGLQIIFTVSPVRHWKDGPRGNQFSKANLIVAIHKLVHLFKEVEYFPSYEIMMDDLRDYRFYNEDMVHPSDQAINYIWEKFINTYFNKNSIHLLDEVDKLIQALRHRTNNSSSDEYKTFINKQVKIAEILVEKYGINLNETIISLKSKIK